MNFRGVVDFIRSAAVARYPAREKLYDVVHRSLFAFNQGRWRTIDGQVSSILPRGTTRPKASKYFSAVQVLAVSGAAQTALGSHFQRLSEGCFTV